MPVRSLRILFAFFLASSCGAFAQAQHDPAVAMAAQVEAMKAFAAIDGVWRGPAWTLLPNGESATSSRPSASGASSADP
jgi:hypothetical protein